VNYDSGPFSYLPGGWGVLSLFCIPIGGGIPSGVLLAQQRGLGWPLMMGLYFVSDLLLAMVFEPVMHGLFFLARRSPLVAAIGAHMNKSMQDTASFYGKTGGPFTLVMIAFGVDPMTGRTAAQAAGHGFVAGWAIAITGDMMYFTLIMVSTLWLHAFIKDPNTVAVLILVGMFGVPWLAKKLRKTPAPVTQIPS
jgi:hypothetical protein